MVEDKGDISEWNEGNFKSMRLHEAQEVINQSKSNPMQIIYIKCWNITDWSYKIWFKGSNVVFGEGLQKYSISEFKEVNKLKAECEELIEKLECSPIRNPNTNSIQKFYIPMKDWLKLKEKLEEFEYLSKKYNDKHGFSTKNVGTKGLF